MEQWWCRFTWEHFSNKWLEFSPDGDATCVLDLLLSLAHAMIIPPGGGDSAYERRGDARRKFLIKPQKETDLGGAQAFFDP